MPQMSSHVSRICHLHKLKHVTLLTIQQILYISRYKLSSQIPTMQSLMQTQLAKCLTQLAGTQVTDFTDSTTIEVELNLKTMIQYSSMS